MTSKTSTKTSTKTNPGIVYTSGAVLLALCKATDAGKMRPALHDVAASVDDRGVVSFAATDAFRLAVVEIGEAVDAGHADAAGRWSADEIKRLVKAADLVAVDVDAGAVALKIVGKAGAPALEIPASPTAGAFPDWHRLLNTSKVEPARARPHIANVDACYLADACAMVKAMCGSMRCVSLRNGGGALPLIATAKLSGKIGRTGRENSGRLWYLLMPVRDDAAEGDGFEAPAGWYDLEETAGADKAAQDRIKELKATVKQLKHKLDDGMIAANCDILAKLEAANKTCDAQRAKIAALEATAAAKPAAQAEAPAPATPAGVKPGTLEAIAAGNDALAYWRTPLCEWVAGDTRPHAAALKAAGAKWSVKKNAWYKCLETAEAATA